MRDIKSKSYQELKDIIAEAQKEMESREDAVIIYARGTVNHGWLLGIFKDKGIDVKSIRKIVNSSYDDRDLERAINGKNPVYVFSFRGMLENELSIWTSGELEKTTLQEWIKLKGD